MRDHILLYINGRPYRVTGSDLLLTLSDFLRRRVKLTGTKVVCSEGDCGSCTVLCGRRAGDAFCYRPIDSCICFMLQLDSTHVVSVEGLCGVANDQPDRRLNEVQQRMVECHGSQCGFCTPGFVMTMTGLFEQHQQLTESNMRYGLTGNLCRCTGYVPIIEAGLSCEPAAVERLDSLYPVQEMMDCFQTTNDDSIAVTIDTRNSTHRVFCPRTIDETVELTSAHPNASLTAGATDIGVQINKGRPRPDVWIDLNRVDELEGVQVTDGVIVAGARATWTEIEQIARETVPEFHRVVSVFGSPQIRHVGTLGGNIVNASPIADSIPLLFVCDAQLSLVSSRGQRRVNINDFYLGYKRCDLQPGELLSTVRIPIPPARRLLRLYKIARRRDLDISTFTAAIWIDLAGDIIQDAGVAYGAVGPVVLRLAETEAFLRGKPFNENTMQQAGDVAACEISPISDVRGSTEYRLQLARNVLVKFYHQAQLAEVD